MWRLLVCAAPSYEYLLPVRNKLRCRRCHRPAHCALTFAMARVACASTLASRTARMLRTVASPVGESVRTSKNDTVAPRRALKLLAAGRPAREDTAKRKPAHLLACSCGAMCTRNGGPR